MGCTSTKVSDQGSEEEDGRISEVISKSLSFTGSQKSVKSHTSPSTRDLVEECQSVLAGVANEEEMECSNLHCMIPPAYMEGGLDSYTDSADTQMDIPVFLEEENSELNRLKSGPLQRTEEWVTGFYRSGASRLSSRLSTLFSPRSEKADEENLPTTDDQSRGDSVSICGSASQLYRDDKKKDVLKNTNGRMSALSKRVADCRGISSNEAMAAIHSALEENKMRDDDIPDDGRSSAASSGSEVFPPAYNFRIYARPNAAKGTRTINIRAAHTATGNNISEFEDEVEKLMETQAMPNRDFRNRSLRPGGAKGPRLPSFSCQRIPTPRPGTGSGSAASSGMGYSKHFADTVNRSQLTVQGMRTATDDCLNDWMSRQQ